VMRHKICQVDTPLHVEVTSGILRDHSAQVGLCELLHRVEYGSPDADLEFGGFLDTH